MGSLDDSSLIFRYHRDMIAWHGLKSSLALGWRNDHDQEVRFSTLSGIADLNHCSVLDAGCGYADLYPYLKAKYPELASYYGIEQIPELIDEAIHRYKHLPNVSFSSRNFLVGDLPVTDYILVNGALNYTSTIPNFIYKAIEHLFSHCNWGLGFNLLSEIKDGTLAAYDPGDIIAFCRTLTPHVVFKDGYAENDFTVFLYHPV